MGAGHRNPAIYAGLLGVVMGTTPTPAMALSMEQLLSNSAAPYLQFAFGCVAGAAFTGAIHIAHSALAGKRGSGTDQAPEAQGAVVVSNDEEADPVAAQQTAAPEVEVVLPSEPVAEETTEKPAAMRPLAASKAPARHMAARDWEASGVIRVQEVSASKSSGPKHRATKPAKQSEASQGSRRGAHFATSARESAAKPKAEKAPVQEHPAVADAVVEPAGAVPQESRSGAHAATDYSDIASKYVQKKTLRDRMAARAAGVASILAERLGGDPMKGMPVITRADGSAGDLGATWWDSSLGSSIRRAAGYTGEVANAQPSAPRVDLDARDVYDQNTEASRRAALISKSVAEVNVGIYPERRTADDLEHEDVWDQALKAMSERMMPRQPYPVFADAIGTIDTLDEPAGLEDATGFIPFRYHANHPEMVDTSTYVDYLIDDEFSRNPSRAARKSSRDFLTVIQGGSQKMRATANQEGSEARHPKHFAAPRQSLAKEA